MRLTIALAGDEPPSEFRIFAAGQNETVKGTFIFDAKAALSVMADYAAHGIDVMLDYAHASLVSERSPDPAQAGKAAGWCKLALRAGELWAVDVRWTKPAAEALRRKEWRFMSPAFQADESGRILSLINVAITNLPATRRLAPLMAASLGGLAMLDAETVKKALEALQSGDAEACMTLLSDMIASAASGDVPPPADAPALADAPAPAPEDEDKAAVAASISHLTRVTGKVTLSDVVDVVETWRTSHLQLEASTKQLAKERAAIELGKRKENAVTLTKLGAETPHTTGLASGTLCKRLLDEPLDEQNARVATMLAANGGKVPASPRPPAGAADPSGETKTFVVEGKTVTLDARELKICAETKCEPQTFALLKSRRAPTAA